MNKTLYYIAVAANENAFKPSVNLQLEPDAFPEGLANLWSKSSEYPQNLLLGSGDGFRTNLVFTKGSKHEQLFNAAWNLASVLAASETDDYEEETLNLLEELASNLKGIRGAKKMLDK